MYSLEKIQGPRDILTALHISLKSARNRQKKKLRYEPKVSIVSIGL